MGLGERGKVVKIEPGNFVYGTMMLAEYWDVCSVMDASIRFTRKAEMDVRIFSPYNCCFINEIGLYNRNQGVGG